jgi:hypothetical protein
MDAQWACKTFESISTAMQTTTLSSEDSKMLKAKVLHLSSDLQLYGDFAKTEAWLSERSAAAPEELNRVYRLRVASMVRDVYGYNPDPRLQQLRLLDIATFVFLAATYKSLAITKMARAMFERLMVVTPIYVRKRLPPGWMFEIEIHLGIWDGTMTNDQEQARSLKRSTYLFLFVLMSAQLIHKSIP